MTRKKAPLTQAEATSPEITTKGLEATPAELRDLADHPRVTVRRGGAPDPAGRCVVCILQRAQRGEDNHAVDMAVRLGNALGLPVVGYFAAIADFPGANLRHYAFLGQGLPDIAEDLEKRGIGFVMRRAVAGEPGREDRARFCRDVHAAIVVMDENPMREPERWRQELTAELEVPFWTVDADSIVPAKLFPKAQYAAYTMRPRMMKLLPDWLQPFENPRADKPWKRPRGLVMDDVHKDITAGWDHLDRAVKPVEAWTGGSRAGIRHLQRFTGQALKDYPTRRNMPEVDGTSSISPYLHFGHVCSQTVCLAIQEAVGRDHSLKAAADGYFGEIVTWRELSVNFVRFSPVYDQVECAEAWAQKTIAEHDRDPREHVYSVHELEAAHTYDPLWNAAQTQMNRYGWMHNYMRMYWAKKILEWTPDVRTAMHTCIYLNDKYFIDGRDPNGYSGVAWAILGKFDRAWGSRAVFGKRRYMSGESTGRKFNSKLYMEQMQALPEG